MLYEVVLLNHHLEIHRLFQVVGKGTHHTVHETVDSAHREVAVAMKNGTAKVGCHIAQVSVIQCRKMFGGTLLVKGRQQGTPHPRLSRVSAMFHHLA